MFEPALSWRVQERPKNVSERAIALKTTCFVVGSFSTYNKYSVL